MQSAIPAIEAPEPPVRTLLAQLLEQSPFSQAELARLLGVSQASVSQWVSGVKRVPAEQCAAIERVTKGKIKRKDLRPDLFGPL